jgi:hypothetical protein
MRKVWKSIALKRSLAFNAVIVILYVLIPHYGLSQNYNEFKTHLYSIDTSFFPLRNSDAKFNTTNANLALVQIIIEDKLEDPNDSIYISNRKLLPIVKRKSCTDEEILFLDSNSNNETIELEILLEGFNVNSNKITYDENGLCCMLINGRYPYGSEYMIPSTTISNIRLEVDGTEVSIPDSAYSDLFNIRTCLSGDNGFFRGAEVYTSISEENIYLYLYGSGEASSYFTKLILIRKPI